MNMQENNYFTQEIQEGINEMSDSQMKQVLLELEGTIYWTAILKYSQQRMIVAQGALLTVDPIAKATEMCRTQGIMQGISDLQGMVISLKEIAKRNEPEKTKEKE